MITEVEDSGEAGAGERGLVPGAVGQLGLDQVIDAAADGRPKAPAGGDESQRGPGGLRRRRLAGPLERAGRRSSGRSRPRRPRAAGSTRAIPGPLEEPRLIHGKSESGLQPLQDLPGAVDVIDAPAAIPAALGLLGAPEVIEGAADRPGGRRDSPGCRAARGPGP